MSASDIEQVVIVGSGPAGYTAALYAARAGLNPLVFEGFDYGGSLMTTSEVENFPGFPTGIMGPDLMENMRQQAERFGARLEMEDVDGITLDTDSANPVHQVQVGDRTIATKTIILAMGAAPRYLGIPGENELLGRGVSACATCDGFFFKDHDIAVIGGGDSAMEEATFLTRFAKSVTLIHRRDEFRASEVMVQRAKDNDKIKFVLNSTPVKVLGDESVSGLLLKDTVTGEESELPVTAMFVAIGHDPRSGLVAGQVELDDAGYVQVAQPGTATNVPGVFAAGDLVDSHYQQAITAAGSGCRAALDAQHYLEQL